MAYIAATEREPADDDVDLPDPPGPGLPGRARVRDHQGNRNPDRPRLGPQHRGAVPRAPAHGKRGADRGVPAPARRGGCPPAPLLPAHPPRPRSRQGRVRAAGPPRGRSAAEEAASRQGRRMRLTERLLRAVLRLAPRAFTDRYRDELLDTHRAPAHRAAPGGPTAPLRPGRRAPP